MSWNLRLGNDVVLLEFTVGLVEQLSADEAVGIIVRWPGHQPAESLLWALLGGAVHLPEPYRNSWDQEGDEPVGGQFAHLWKLLRVLPAELQVQAARRWLRLQAVLLEHGNDLAAAVLEACVPVLSDPNLGAPGPVSVAGRLATLRRWSDRHPGLGELAAAARRAAGRDAARALRDPKLWDRVLPSTPDHFAQDLLELRPHLSEPLQLEILARVGVHSYSRDRFEKPIVVPDDDELTATGNPPGMLTGLLMQLPTAGRPPAARLAAGLLHSRYADATVLAALPAEVVRQSPWHADLAVQMLAEACGDDPARWALAPRVSVNR